MIRERAHSCGFAARGASFLLLFILLAFFLQSLRQNLRFCHLPLHKGGFCSFGVCAVGLRLFFRRAGKPCSLRSLKVCLRKHLPPLLSLIAGGETMLTAFAQGLLRKHLPPLQLIMNGNLLFKNVEKPLFYKKRRYILLNRKMHIQIYRRGGVPPPAPRPRRIMSVRRLCGGFAFAFSAGGETMPLRSYTNGNVLHEHIGKPIFYKHTLIYFVE